MTLIHYQFNPFSSSPSLISFQAQHRWYNWGTYACGDAISNSSIVAQVNKNAAPTGPIGALPPSLCPVGGVLPTNARLV